MDATPRSSTDSDADSFVSGRSSPLNGFDSSAALILVPDSSDDSAHGSAAFGFSLLIDDGIDELRALGLASFCDGRVSPNPGCWLEGCLTDLQVN